MNTHVRNTILWVGAALAVVAATVLYQPDAAKTGTLLVWTNDRLYTMDIDTLLLTRLAPVGRDEALAASPGCDGHIEMPCWVVAGQRLIRVTVNGADEGQTVILPIGQDDEWLNGDISWSPDGRHFVYSVRNTETGLAEWRIYNASRQAVELALSDVNPEVIPAWAGTCRDGLNASGCHIAYQPQGESTAVVSYTFADGSTELWSIEIETVDALKWHRDGDLLFSDEPRHFYSISSGEPAFDMPTGAQLAGLSPNGRYSIYYHPFTLSDCAPDADDCLYLGVWLSERDSPVDAKLLYQLQIGSVEEGLNFVPVWAPTGEQLVFFQNGRLIHYDLQLQEGQIWYRPVRGKLRSLPVFSPFEPAVAFVDSQGQGVSDYRLVVVNPKLQPIEHILKSDSGLRLLSWLPW